MLVLGLDPGSRHTGYGLVESQGDRLRAVAHGRISCQANQAVERRRQLPPAVAVSGGGRGLLVAAGIPGADGDEPRTGREIVEGGREPSVTSCRGRYLASRLAPAGEPLGHHRRGLYAAGERPAEGPEVAVFAAGPCHQQLPAAAFAGVQAGVQEVEAKLPAGRQALADDGPEQGGLEAVVVAVAGL